MDAYKQEIDNITAENHQLKALILNIPTNSESSIKKINEDPSLNTKEEVIKGWIPKDGRKKIYKQIYLFLSSKGNNKNNSQTPYFQIKNHTTLSLYQSEEKMNKRDNYKPIEQYVFQEIFLNQKV